MKAALSKQAVSQIITACELLAEAVNSNDCEIHIPHDSWFELASRLPIPWPHVDHEGNALLHCAGIPIKRLPPRYVEKWCMGIRWLEPVQRAS